MSEELKREDFFSPQKRFSDSINSQQIFILDRDLNVFGKMLRAGSAIRIIAWREINDTPYLVVNKGTWESLIPLKEIANLLPKKKE